MKGDYSKLSGRKAQRKHFSEVRKQQGRVHLDSDWNELLSIIAHQRNTRTIDTIGQNGAPIHDSGFQIFHPEADMDNLLIATGRMYAGGLLCETTPSTKLPIKKISGQEVEVDDLNVDGIWLKKPEIAEGVLHKQWVQIITDEEPDGAICQIEDINVNSKVIKLDQDISSLSSHHHPFLRLLLLYSEQPDFPNAPAVKRQAGQTHLVYLDIWQRHLTAIEDPELREVALGGPDTDTRSKVIAQVKILRDENGPVNVGAVECTDEIDAWEELIQSPNGRLTAKLQDPNPTANPCELGESGGYHGLENRLYRVEIHRAGPAQTATFKWSRDNAAQAYAIDQEFVDTDPHKIKLKQNGKDDILKIKPNDWIEVSSEQTDLDTDQPGVIVQVEKIDGAVLTLKDIVDYKNESIPKIRRWDVSEHLEQPETTIEINQPFQLEHGIEIEFSGENFRTGDCWVFSARPLTGKIEELEQAPPLGVDHHYCKLALVTWVANAPAEIEDCRPEFPPLTEIKPGAGGCCTAVVGEGGDFQDIQLAVDALEGGPGTVCILPGVYVIDEAIHIKDARDITIKGCEGSSLIINRAKSGSTTVFNIHQSSGISINHLWCVSMAGDQCVIANYANGFQLHDCFLLAGGVGDQPGVLTFRDATIDTRAHNNLLLGITAIRYDTQGGQEDFIHAAAAVENNVLFSLESCIRQIATIMPGFDLVDNFMCGFGTDLLSKAFLPAPLFLAAEKSGLYSPDIIAEAKEKRKEGIAFEAIKPGQVSPVFDLYQFLKAAPAGIQMKPENINPTEYPTTEPVVALLGYTLDANIVDNLLIGYSSVFANHLTESNLEKNQFFAKNQGVELKYVNGVTLRDNYIDVGVCTVKCSGSSATDLTVDNNRLISQQNGIQFRGQEAAPSISNLQVSQNRISAKETGIQLDNPELRLQDFTVVDNSFSKCEAYGILLNVFDDDREARLRAQRVIQRNSFVIAGIGLDINVSDVKVTNNEINIHRPRNLPEWEARGIVLRAGSCTIAHNIIRGYVNINAEIYTHGGIYLLLKRVVNTYRHNIHIHNNRILGGRHNGIGIKAYTVNGLTIEENEITGMGLNGIAVEEEGITTINNLQIKGNHISNGHQLTRWENWWQYAAIVLASVRNAQISGNLIENGLAENRRPIITGCLYIKAMWQITISDNQFVYGEGEILQEEQAVIHSPEANSRGNQDIKITGNLIKGAPIQALIMGNYKQLPIVGRRVYNAIDEKAIITSNHFEMPFEGPIVLLNNNRCIFSNNYVECGGDKAVDLRYSSYVFAEGNILSGTIDGGDPNHTKKSNNITF